MKSSNHPIYKKSLILFYSNCLGQCGQDVVRTQLVGGHDVTVEEDLHLCPWESLLLCDIVYW